MSKPGVDPKFWIGLGWAFMIMGPIYLGLYCYWFGSFRLWLISIVIAGGIILVVHQLVVWYRRKH